jgi:hypothetical protein
MVYYFGVVVLASVGDTANTFLLTTMRIFFFLFSSSPQTFNGAILVHVEGELYEPAAAPAEKKLSYANMVPQKSGITEQISPRTSVSNTLLKNTPDKCPLPRPKQKLELVKEHTHR